MIYRENKVGQARVVTYVLDNYAELDLERRRSMVIVCPGGGYHFCSEREAESVAIRFNSLGFNALVLYYAVNSEENLEGIYPRPQEDLANTIKWVRENADELNTNPDKIAVLGFSAGGHLAASLGVFWPEYGEEAKPNALVLCYSVITSGPLAHQRSIRNLVGTDEKLWAKMSLENQVSAQTPPSFIWHTRTDNAVPYENSLMFKEALDRFGVKNERVV